MPTELDAPAAEQNELARILGLEVPVLVTLAERDLSVQSILQMKVGTILEFDLSFNANLILQAGDQPIGEGKAVKIGENFGLRIEKIGTVRDRIGALARA